MRLPRPKRWSFVAGTVLVIAALGVGIAVAAQSVATDTTNVRLRVIQSEFTTGFDSGWHTHPGPVIVQVQKGHFKITQGRCEAKDVEQGETYLEVPLVPVRAVAKGEIKWTTSQILPGDAATATTVASPCQED